MNMIRNKWDRLSFIFSRQSLIFPAIALLFFLQGCITIHPGEIGLKIVRGKLKPNNYLEGRHSVGFGIHYVKISTRITEYSAKLTLPTKEGLEAKVDITLLYHVKPESVRDVFLKLGLTYQKSLILNNCMAIARETCLNYPAIDLITQRDDLEKAIFTDLNKDVGPYGFVVDQVLVRDIDLPDEIDKVIANKVRSEQMAKQVDIDIARQKKETEALIEKQRREMDFNFEKEKRENEFKIQERRAEEDFQLEKQKKESERTLIEAQASKKVQDLLNSSITDKLIKYKSLEVQKAFANSPNSKLIITDGRTPISLKEIMK